MSLERWDQEFLKAKRPHYTLSKKQLRKRLFVVGQEKKQLSKKQHQLQKRLDKIVNRDGLTLDDTFYALVTEIVSKECEFDKDSVMHLLWSQQKKSNSFKKQTSMRWHPVLIRWCLSIYLKSPGKCVLLLIFPH